MAGLGALSFSYHDQEHTDNKDEAKEDYYIPLQSSRPFGAGIKRKRVAFVPAAADVDVTENGDTITKGTPNISAKYLSIVLGGRDSGSSSSSSGDNNSSSSSQPQTQTQTHTNSVVEDNAPLTNTTTNTNTNTTPTLIKQHLCPICAEPLSTTTTRSNSSLSGPSVHESSITHQLALQHHHPPSHLDRQRKGLRYLVSQGWDPDARLGLGARGREGIRVPVKAVEKRDTAGLGLFSSNSSGDAVADGSGSDEERKRKRAVQKKEEETATTTKKLNAKQVREAETEKKKRAEQLRSAFYGEDLSRYLGPNG